MTNVFFYFPANLWSEGETKVLFNYYTLFSQVGPFKKFRTRKARFENIAMKIKELVAVTRTGTQCELRFKTLIRTKKNQVDNNRKSGSARCTISFKQEFAAIAALDDSIEPDVMRGVRNVIYKQRPTASSASAAADKETPNEASGSSRHTEEPTPTRNEENRPRAADRSLRPSTDRMKHVFIFR